MALGTRKRCTLVPMSGLPGCPAAAVGCKRQRNQPYDWLWDADAELITAMLNFVSYDGPPLRSRGQAVEALTSHSSLFGGEDRGQWRFRLGKGRNRIKRSTFAASVRAGMRWDGRRRGPNYVDYLNQPWPQQPFEPGAAVSTPPPPNFDAAIASGGDLFTCTVYKSDNAFCALGADHDRVVCPIKGTDTRIGGFHGCLGKLRLHARGLGGPFDLHFETKDANTVVASLQVYLKDIVKMQWAEHGHWASVLRVVSKYLNSYMIFNLIFAQANQLTSSESWKYSSRWYGDNFVRWIGGVGGARVTPGHWVSPNQPAAAPPAPAPPAPAPKPPKPVVPPNPGPAPVKPSGERFAAQHPFTAAELQLCDSKFSGTSLKDLIENRARNFPEASDQWRALMCMWQVATLCRPDDALGRMHAWVLRLTRSLYWRGVRVGSSPRVGSMDDQCEA